MTARRMAMLVAVSALAAGCAATAFYGLAPGQSTEGDVRRALGEPAMAFAAADGSRSLLFPRGPLGTRTYRASLSADGKLTGLEQVLTEEHFQRIAVGRTSSGEVERLIGPPWRRVAFDNKRQVAWDYRFVDSWGYRAEFSVMLDENGIVAETVTVRLNESRNGRD